MYSVDKHRLGAAIKAKMAGRSLRDVAPDIGITITTLSRISNAHNPDIDTFWRLCVWLEARPEEFIIGIDLPDTTFVEGFNPIETIEYLLRYYEKLSDKAIDAIMQVIGFAITAENGKES